uniref:Uncharacterized protein n=1 Tax=Meloidogyne enterolobii TaxID=390850 RepID=A0A6V7VK54_MELEN|nr:unnamed protein product [Meloidogyne enterolobii]
MKSLLERIWPSGRRRRRPFRGLRRAAASPGSPISCCSQTCNASGSAQISIPPFPRTHCTVMVIAGTRPPTVPPSSAGSCISPSSIWTPSSTAGGISTPNRQQQINFPFDEQQNNENEQLILHFPHLPPSPNVLASKDNEAEQPILISLEQQQSLISQYGFQTHRPRPPLNRAIPPIPESRSNESIQSSQSMLTRRPSNGLQLQTVQIIDENNPIDEPVPKQTMTGDDVMGVSTITIKETTNITTKTSRLPKFVRRKEKKDSVEQEEKKQQKPPKSPLMSVAHSVKNKLSRLTRGGNAMSSSAGAEFPMSRSLEIGSKTRIPHRQTSDEIPKSKSMEEQRGMNENSGGFFLVPRRSPTTTLVLCSPGGGPRRLPPDEFLEQQKEPQLLSNKQVQFVDEEDNLHKLSPQKELAFCVWTPEIENNLIVKINEEIKEKEGNEKIEEGEVEEMSKIEGQTEIEKIIEEQEKKDIDGSSSVLKAKIGFEEEKQPTSSSQPPIITEPPPEQSKPISSVGETTITTITTTRRSRSPPRVLLTSLRKSPQSFPPLGNSSLDSQQNLAEKNGRQTKSTVSVSFGEVDVKKYNENKEEIKGKEELTKQKGEEKSGKEKSFQLEV